jgi:hypothetical protein
MSLTGKRQEIADACSTVPDCHGFPKRPSTPNVGDCWPLLARGDRESGDAFMITWAVRVSVPQDEFAAADWWDEHWPPLYFALKSAGYVGSFAPIAIAIQGGDHLAYEITMQAEE